MSAHSEMEEMVAKAMWASSNPFNADNGVIVGDMGDGWTLEQDLDLDWDLNKDSFIKLARVAIEIIDAALQPEEGKS